MANRPAPLNLINQLYRTGLDLIARDMKAIEQSILHNGDKLEPGHARDLRDYLKLLGDMKKAQEAIRDERNAKAKAAKKTVSDEDLERAIAGAAPVGSLGPKDPQ